MSTSQGSGEKTEALAPLLGASHSWENCSISSPLPSVGANHKAGKQGTANLFRAPHQIPALCLSSNFTPTVSKTLPWSQLCPGSKRADELLSVSVEAFTTFKRQGLNVLLWFFCVFYLGDNKISYCFPGGAESTYQCWSLKRCLSLIPGLGRSPGGGNGNPVLLPGKIPWTEEPGVLQSMGSQRVRHD